MSKDDMSEEIKQAPKPEQGDQSAYIEFAKYVAAISITVFTGMYNILDVNHAWSAWSNLFVRIGFVFLLLSLAYATILIYNQLPLRFNNKSDEGADGKFFRRVGRPMEFGNEFSKDMESQTESQKTASQKTAHTMFWCLVVGVMFCLPHVFITLL